MMETPIKINVKIRSVGKSATHRLRKHKMVPAIVYGCVSNHPIALEERLLTKYAHKKFENTIFHLQCSENNELNNTLVLIKSLDRDPITQKPLHLDFYAPDMKKEIRIAVELKFIGKPAGEVEGGVLELMQRDIELFCLPNHIPRQIEVDVSSLKIGDIYHISHLQLPKGVKSAASTDLPICAVKEPRKTTIETPKPAAEAEAAAQSKEGAKTQKSEDTTSKGDKKDSKK